MGRRRASTADRRCRHEPNPALVQHAQERAGSVQNQVADRITAFAGSMSFVYIHIIWFSCWIGFGVEDYPFGLLTMIVSLEAIFLSTFVLISQNRADARRQVIADEQWQTVQKEDRQNEELLELSHRILELTTAMRGGTTRNEARSSGRARGNATDARTPRACPRPLPRHPLRRRRLRLVPGRIGRRRRLRVGSERTRDDGVAARVDAGLLAAHVWSDAMGERIARGDGFRPNDVLRIARGNGLSSRPPRSQRFSSLSPGLAPGPARRVRGWRCSRPRAGRRVGTRAGRRRGGSWLAATVLAAGNGMLAVLLIGRRASSSSDRGRPVRKRDW